MPDPLHVCVIAGEASGDVLGSALIRALKARVPVRFSGVGGTLMQAEGLDSLFPMTDLSVMGLAEVLPRLPKLIARINQTAAHVQNSLPDIVVTVDSPDFSFRVARKIKAQQRQPKLIHYVAPTVWAWRPERAAKVAKLYDGLLCLFPFEPPYFEREGLRAAFTGHPVMDTAAGKGNGAAFRQGSGIAADATVLGLFLGSRMGELNRMGPVLREAALKLAKTEKNLFIVSPTLPHLAREVRNFMREMPCKSIVLTDPAVKWDAFAAMDGAMATSGTVGLELAVAGVPHIIGYRMNPLTFEIVKRKIRVRYAHLANILLDRGVVPEFIQKDCTAENMAEVMREVFQDQTQKQAFEQVRNMLSPSGKSPSEAAAAFVLDVIAKPSGRSNPEP